jgi:hypothetical protein
MEYCWLQHQAQGKRSFGDINLHFFVLDLFIFYQLQGRPHFYFPDSHKGEKIFYFNQTDIFFFQLPFIG